MSVPFRMNVKPELPDIGSMDHSVKYLTTPSQKIL